MLVGVVLGFAAMVIRLLRLGREMESLERAAQAKIEEDKAGTVSRRSE